MRRLVLLVAVGAFWLFLAALPALADGGPHVSTINNGSLGIKADSCAGCHRAHTAQGPYLINAADEEALCLTCHGSAGVGSTLDVMTGVQYKVALPPGSAGQGTSPGVLLGALRDGGFDQARLDAGNAARVTYPRTAPTTTAPADMSNRPRVGVGAPEDVTSAHLSFPDDPATTAVEGNGLTMPGIAWGNGANGSGAGPAVELSCASCHNPHGNGQYRILNPIPEVNDVGTGGTDFVAVGTGVTVTDSPVDNPDIAESDVKNYTVIQTKGNPADVFSYLLYADDVLDSGFGPTEGDYMHRNVPWVTSPERAPISGVAGNVFTTTVAHGLTTPVVVGIGTGDAWITGISGLTDGFYDIASVPSATTFTIVGPAVTDQTPTAAYSSRIGGGSGALAPANDAPNGVAASFSAQITAWCSACHTRYFADNNPNPGGLNGPPPTNAVNPPTASSWWFPRPGDTIYKYQHRTVPNRACVTCHVSHGTNAAMPGQFSGSVAYPNGDQPGDPGVTNGNSRLLKIDNRGTCQACHDPTNTIKPATLAGPATQPSVP